MGVLPKGVKNNNFNFVYTNRDDSGMVKDLGYSILKMAEKVPDGMLVFFPSYFLMDKAYE